MGPTGKEEMVDLGLRGGKEWYLVPMNKSLLKLQDIMRPST